jgi:RING finger protein 113A
MRTIQHSNGIDRNPMRCKDYFESGYCAFGNSCIFIHDRSDYKSGAELDSEWNEKNKHKVDRRKIR